MQAKWESFVRMARKNWTHATDHVGICGRHFVVPEDFEGYKQWKMGYKKSLELKVTVIPSIKGSATSQDDMENSGATRGIAAIDAAEASRTPECTTACTPMISIGQQPQRRGAAVRKLTVARVCQQNYCYTASAYLPVILLLLLLLLLLLPQ